MSQLEKFTNSYVYKTQTHLNPINNFNFEVGPLENNGFKFIPTPKFMHEYENILVFNASSKRFIA